MGDDGALPQRDGSENDNAVELNVKDEAKNDVRYIHF